MKKIFSTLCVAFGALTLTACMDIPACNDADLDGCGRNSAYTEERTVGIMGHRQPAQEEPAPAPMPEPVAEPVVEEEPPDPVMAPPPEPVDTQFMQEADEPDYMKGLK